MSNDFVSNFLSPQFDVNDVDVIADESLYQGFFSMRRLDYRHRLYQGGWSKLIQREVLFRGDAVGAVLYDPNNDLIGLVEQIRPGAIGTQASPWCLEVVAGMVEEGESNEDVVWRELKEEADIVPSKVEYVCEYMASPGGCDERLHVFCALAELQGLNGGVHGLDTEGEDIRLMVLPAEQVFENLYGGRFNNAATMIGLQWLQMNRQRLRAE